MPITVPASVKVAVKDGYIHVEGPKGKLNCKTRDEVTLKIGKEEIIVEVADDSKASNSYHGLYRQ